MSQLVVERLRKMVLDNRQQRQERPGERPRQVYVDPSGRVVLGDEVTGEPRELSEVHQAVFAAGAGPAGRP